MGKIKVFVAEGCGPCSEIKKANLEEDLVLDGVTALSQGEDVDIELIDVTSEAGFDNIAKYGLDAVPKAVIEGGGGRFEVCPIVYDEAAKKVLITCGEQPAS